MEFFNKAKTVRLRSHLSKYLVADEDEITVRQSRNGASNKARWTVEFIAGKSHVIRLKSCYGKYLTPSEYEPFLLGMTGNKVVQDIQANKRDTSVEWEPIKEGAGRVKLRGKGGKFLRANWGTPPWRNSVTYDVPNRTATQDWVLWEVDVVEISTTVEVVQLESQESSLTSYSSSNSSVSTSVPEDYSGVDSRPLSMASNGSDYTSGRQGGMEFFHRAKAVRLQSHHGKYLVADEDEETVRQSRNGSSQKARWTIEYPEGKPNIIRLKSCHGLYLTATNEPFLLGMTGKRVQQLHSQKDPATEWEPIKEGAFHVKLRTREGKFLRANGGAPPWRNSITHDIPHRTATQDWVLWGVDVVDIVISNLETVSSIVSVASSVYELDDDYSGSPEVGSPIEGSPIAISSGLRHASRRQMDDSYRGSSVKSEGRIIHYSVVDDDGNVDDGIEGKSFQFRGHGLEDLTQKLEEETGLENVIVCSRNPLNEKLYPLRLSLPPNNAAMNIVLVPPTSKAARDFLPPST